MLKEYLTDIANVLRDKLGLTDTINAREFSNRIIEVYDTGNNDGYSSGYDVGFSTGKGQGYTKGYDDGYDKGYADNQAIIDGLIDRTVQRITSNATKVAKHTFIYNTTLHYLTIPEATEIGAYACSGCTGLWSLKAPKLEKIDVYAFEKCNQAGAFTFESVTSIQSYAFSNAAAVTKLIIKTTNCTLASTTAFNGTPIASGTGYIYVPDEAVETYKTKTNWATYANQIKGISELPT